VLKLEGVDSIDDGERLRGQELVIPQDELPELPEGSYYHHELIGLPAEDEGGQPLGRVRALLDTGAVPNLVLEQEGQEERLVPLAAEFFKRLDRARGVVVLAPPVWAQER
jgi:16S rRNA processing protein RimM